MSNKDWTEKLRDRLENHQVAAPDDLWADIEAGLDAARQPSMSSLPTGERLRVGDGTSGMGGGRGSRKRRAVLVPLRRWGVAAAIAALGIVGWQLAGSGGGEEKELAYPSLQQEAPSNLPQKGEATDSENSLTSYHSPLTSNHSSKVGKNEPQLAMADKPLAADALRIVEDNLPADEIKQPFVDENKEEALSNPSSVKEANDSEKSLTIPEQNSPTRSLSHHLPLTSKNSSPMGKDSHSPLNRGIRGSFTLYASNGLADSRNANGVMMAESMANNYMAAAASMKRSSPTPVIYMAGYEEREQHRQPFSVGLSVGIPLHERFTLTTGLAYTQLHADFLKIMNKRQLAKEQDLQYVGCPVNLNYRFLETKLLKAYVAAGGQIDLNVKAKSATEGVETEMPKDRPQFSTQAAVGLQFDLMPQVGVYVEPGVKYYFDNGSNVRTFFKDKPCNFNLQVGLRWNFEQ